MFFNRLFFRAPAVLLALALGAGTAFAGALHTTVQDGSRVNANIFGADTDVYINGGPQNLNASGLPGGLYYFQVTDPSGKTLLSTDPAACRILSVAGGEVVGAAPGRPLSCPAHSGVFNPANGSTTVQLAPFSATPNSGNEYKVWIVPVGSATVGSDGKTLSFKNSDASTDNFKVNPNVTPTGSCQPTSSLSVLVNTGTGSVVSYVPKGSWSGGTTGIKAVNVEGSSIVNTTIATASIVNSCASNAVTGVTVCTANNTDVYLLSGTTLGSTVTTDGAGTNSFSGGSCTNCGVAMDAVHNKALIGLHIAAGPGFQLLDLPLTAAGVTVKEPAFATKNPAPGVFISEDPLIDPIRNLVLSASEDNNYELINVATSTLPIFDEQSIAGTAGELDSSGEDCNTGIALAPSEFAGISHVFIANLGSSAFTHTGILGTPGTWSAPSQVQILTGSSLAAGASGIAVAQGTTHQGVVSGEFGGNALTAIQLPTTVDTSAAIPAISGWMTCNIPSFSNGLDPHTVTAYENPAGNASPAGHAFALLANNGATALAKVDLTLMLALPESAPGSHVCAGGTLPATVVTVSPI
jgi:hypothetical protein